MKKEPVAILGGIVALIGAIIPALVLFGLIDWTPDQVAAAMLVVSTAAPVVGSLFARTKVSPVA
ncbi:MAG: hypothetical protein U9N79_03395 [Actinomycetota bacterium]|nr:hypothetical protein [Actinomycetota bacterium]